MSNKTTADKIVPKLDFGPFDKYSNRSHILIFNWDPPNVVVLPVPISQEQNCPLDLDVLAKIPPWKQEAIADALASANHHVAKEDDTVRRVITKLRYYDNGSVFVGVAHEWD
ncbi:hypothetical protein TWF694_001198 [Orbilia ellipsospora]|uniref:Uncharacterized protein n=1 Tax=Orbilia ellipsospora TaxID=2528407 RepID=A0AAV9XQX9_9PEZI